MSSAPAKTARPERLGWLARPNASRIVVAVALRGELVESAPYTWATWDTAPTTTERVKSGAETFFAYTRGLPRWAD